VSAPQRITPITVTLDVEQPEEREAARFVDAPEPNIPSGPVPLRHDTAQAMWSRFARPIRPMSRKGRP